MSPRGAPATNAADLSSRVASVRLRPTTLTCQSHVTRHVGDHWGDIVRVLPSTVGALAFAAAAFPLQASAAVLFDNGPGLPGVGGPDITRNVSADDFVLSQTSTIRGGSFYYTTGGSVVSRGPLSYFVYSSAYKNGYQQPDAILARGTLTITSTATIPDTSGQNYTTRYLANFVLETPFRATGGQRYWLAMTSDGPEQILWITSKWVSPTATWNHFYSDAPGHWRRSDNERAFALAGSVPEPATWAMMIIGFGAIGTLVRRCRRQVATSV